jgi:hypothetical protein
MRAAKAKEMLSRETLRQIYIQDLLAMGITETRDGTRVNDLDFYEARSVLAIARVIDGTDVNIESDSNKFF